MARIRSIKPEFWSDLSLARLPRDARLLYIALWNQADEHGRLHGDARWVKGHCLPYDDDLNLAAIVRLLDALEQAGKIVRYTVGEPYIYLPKLAAHQRLEAKVPSRLPAPPTLVSPDPDPGPPASNLGESASRADKSASHADEPVSHADPPAEVVALHVAGSREHGAVRARARAKPRADPADAQRVVAAWIEAATARQGDRPAASLINRVGRQVKTLLAEGKPPDRLEHAARAMGGKGFADLGAELLRTPAGPPGVVESVGGWDV